jgi:Bacterial CdiA-CT RNAse A domain/Pretoxin HINT domain
VDKTYLFFTNNKILFQFSLKEYFLRNLIIAMLLCGMQISQAQTSSIPGLDITTSICDPNFCPVNKADYAKKNNCKFLEDICPGLKQDNKGAKAEDKGFWGEAWDTIAAGATYGYEFMKGLATGLIGQVTDLWDLVSSPIETAKGLIELGKAFYDDPKGTIKKLAEVLGQEAVDSITQATQCGPYYLGNTIGKYVSPAVALKIAGKLGKFGKLDDAIKAVKKDFGCASFAADTTVWTSTGRATIQSISIGQLVDSRHDQKWSQALQKVSNTFNRSAPNYYQLRTEEESFRVTEEHPLWVQGKGWTPVKDITDEDVLATQTGDTLVKEISKVNKPLQVYNFAVENTPNYFVGTSGLWAHNSKCQIDFSKGHLEERHIGKTEAELQARYKSQPNITGSSSFKDRVTAELAVAKAIETNEVKIKDFLASNKPTLTIEASMPNSIGILVQPPGTGSAIPASNVRVILKKDPISSTGYSIVTGFPI